jgi:ATP-binding cassette subfamily B protein
VFAERMRAARLSARPTATLAALPVLAQVAVLALGGWLALRHQVSLGTFVAFTGYVAGLVGPVRVLTGLVLHTRMARAGVERVYELIDSQPEVVDAPDARDLPPGPLQIELDGVGFGYTRDEPVLDGVSLTVRPGETLALVGTGGSGKSTVSLLLPRFYDVHAGSVRVGPPGAAADIRELRLSSLRGAVGMVFEEAFLFSDTIRANIAYGHPEATDAEVEAAARAAEAHEFATALPEGYDTVVGERGYTLSGGQRQRIALARALLTDPRILLLDDATSAVDTATEAAILATLRSVTDRRTTVLVARRRSTLALADRIAVLDAGRVVDIGTRAELEQRCPLFRALLAGPGEAIEQVGAGSGAATDRKGPDGTTPALWPAPSEGRGAGPATPAEGDDALLGSLPETEDLLAAVRALPPTRDVPRVDPEQQPDGDAGFSPLRLLRPIRAGLVLTTLLVAGDAAVALVLPAVLRHGVDAGVQAGAGRTLGLTAGLGLVLALLDWVIVTAQTTATARVGETLLYLLRVRSYAHLQRLGLDYYERETGGAVMTRMTTDVDSLAAFVQTGLATTLVSLLTMAGVGIALLATDPSLALVALSGFPVLLVAALLYRRLASAAYGEARERIRQVNTGLQEKIAGLRVIQAFRREKHSARTFAEQSDAYRRSMLRAQRYIATFFPFVGFLGELAGAAVLLVGARQVAQHSLGAGTLLAFWLYLGLFFAPVQQLVLVADGYQQARTGLARIAELLRTRSSVPAAPDAVAVGDRLRGEVEFRDVSFRYPGVEQPALDGVSLHVAPGETVALVGRTGAGKSTLVKLIARLHDVTSGQVLVDGVDVRRYDLAGFRGRLGVVPQEGHLFTGDVAGNVAYTRPDASPAEIEAAVRAVGALGMVAALPAGFRQPIGERGKGLSAGQRQLVALARAELAAPDLLLLDEATAALEPAAEAAVLEAAARVATGRTTFVVAHRLATAAAADRIIVLDGGRVVEQGCHHELLALGGHYARLWSAGDPTADGGEPVGAGEPLIVR